MRNCLRNYKIQVDVYSEALPNLHTYIFAQNIFDSTSFNRSNVWIFKLFQIRFVPHDYTDDVIIHCHILAHEDLGMMMVVKVTDEGKNYLSCLEKMK